MQCLTIEQLNTLQHMAAVAAWSKLVDLIPPPPPPPPPPDLSMPVVKYADLVSDWYRAVGQALGAIDPC